jgi:dipeptidyl aminopeptidase/acylaminoacyl peptidase
LVAESVANHSFQIKMNDNIGTFPINSERLYAAIKGHGGTVRFVYFPYEAHGYRGKENVLHLL